MYITKTVLETEQPRVNVYSGLFIVHVESDDEVVAVVKRGRGRSRKERSPKEKSSVGDPDISGSQLRGDHGGDPNRPRRTRQENLRHGQKNIWLIDRIINQKTDYVRERDDLGEEDVADEKGPRCVHNPDPDDR